ncbi:MAG TPA: LysM peptidoglycan-binding domain-containing protein [Pseudonocardiaceae bacterium]
MTNTYGIQLRHPIAGDLIGNRLTLAAIGTAFEASYGWRLLAPGGAVLLSGYLQAGSMGSMEAFVHQHEITVTHRGPATLQVFGDDPSGQHDPGLDVVTVPVILIPGMTGYRIHLVAAGDTLSAIARDNHSTVADLVAANGIPNPDVIRVGQILRVPLTA